MHARVRGAAAGVAILTLASAARAETPTPFDDLPANAAGAFSGTNVFLFGAAVLATGTMAQTDTDHSIRLAVQHHVAAPAYGDAAYVTGYALPAITAPAVYFVGLATGSPRIAGAGAAALQALGVTLATTGLLKWGTGRPYPLHGGDPHAADRLSHPEYAREWGPFQNGIGAWPSGHTSATTSIIAALAAYAPDQIWIPIVGYPAALAIGFGMVVGDRHWASDVLAGALIGQAIGWSIGTSFRRRAERRGVTVQIAPLGGGVFGATGSF